MGVCEVAGWVLVMLCAAVAAQPSLLNSEGMAFFKTFEALHVSEVTHSGAIDDDWRIGRGTFYGNEPWAWSIHEGSCGYGYIWEDEPLGWDVAALPDVHYEYAGSCGKCYEVACTGIDFKDNYNNHLDRTNVCYNPDESVVVRITDTCPCNYVTNAYSNRRWCCGDMDHFDLSVWAFEKLASRKWGVIGLKYRPVPCDHVPNKSAPTPADAFPPDFSYKPASRPWWLPKSGETPAASRPEQAIPAGSVPKEIYSGEIKSPFWEKSWNSNRVYGWKGPSGEDAFCGDLSSYGALAVASGGQQFYNHVSLEMWVRTEDGVPDLRLQLRGNKGECGLINLKDMQSSGESAGFSRYTIYLGLFDFGAHQARVTAFASEFKGCGSNSASEVEDLYIRNDRDYKQFVCIDSVRLI